MISKAALCHILVIWGLSQVTGQLNRGSIPAGVRSSMIANGWRPLTTFEGNKNAVPHTAPIGGSVGSVVSQNERYSGPHHPVHGKYQEHMAKSEKHVPSSKPTKQSHDYSPPSILGSFSVFGHSMAKIRGNTEVGKKPQVSVASETREYSFLVPPPRETFRYDIDPYRKLTLRENEAYPRQPGQYVITHGPGQPEVRNPPYYATGGAAVAASSHVPTATKNRPLIVDYNGNGLQQPPRQQVHQQHAPFESLKLSNTKHYLQPPSINPASFEPSQRQSEEQRHHFERYPAPSLVTNPQAQQLGQETSGNFYSRINHPSPPGIYNTRTQLEKDPSFLVHESHEISYPTAAPLQSQPGFAAFGNFRPSAAFESLHAAERYSTPRPAVAQTEKFVPSKLDDTRQKQEKYARYNENGGSGKQENSVVTPESPYTNGIVNTYYISEQQSLTPPAPTWSFPGSTKVTPDINEVLPKANRPAKFTGEAPFRKNLPNYLFPLSEIQQAQLQHHQYYSNDPLGVINRQPEAVFETPESISLKHFNEQQHRLQQQLLQRDRDRLREQELQRQQQQIELGRIAAVAKEREREATTASLPETPRLTQYMDTTVAYPGEPINVPEISRLPGQIYLRPEYQEFPFVTQRPDLEGPTIHGVENVSAVDEVYLKVTAQPESTSTQEAAEAPKLSDYRTRPRKPTVSNERRRKPTTPVHEEHTYERPREEYHISTLSPNPIVQSPASPHSGPSSTETPTTAYQASYPSVTTPSVVSEPSSTSTRIPITTSSPDATTQRPRTRRPSGGNLSAGRRRRPTSTTAGTTTTLETTTPSVTYRREEYTTYEKYEAETTPTTRRRKIKPLTSIAQNLYDDHEATTGTEKKRFEIQNYGHKLGAVDQDYITESPENYSFEAEQVSPQQTYSYGNNEQDSLYYTPTYDGLTNGQVTGGHVTDGKLTRGQVAGGQVTDGHLTRGQATGGQVTDGQLNRGQVTDGQLNRDQVTNGESGNRVTNGESGNRVTNGESGNRVTNGESGNRVTNGESGNRVTNGPTRGQVTRGQITRSQVTTGPNTRGQVTTGQIPTTQEFADYETSAYPASFPPRTNQGASGEREYVDNVEIAKNVFTSVPLEELFVETEKTFTTAPSTTARTTTAKPTTTVAPPTRSTHSRTTSTTASSPESAHTTRPTSHRMRPMRFGNATRPRFSIKDYKSRLDYRNRMSTSSEAPNSSVRQKTGSSRNQQPEAEIQPMESTTLRYRHMPRVSYRMPTTTPSYHAGRTRSEANDSTTERTNRFTPKRRLHNNHLYRSKISSTTTVEPLSNDASDPTTSTRQTSVRNENVFSSSIRRRPQMKHAVLGQSSDSRTSTRREPTEMVPEETSFYSSAISQLLVTDPSSTTKNEDETERHVTNEDTEGTVVTSTTEQIELSSTESTPLSENADNVQPIRVEDTNVSEYQQTTTINPEPGQTEALVKDDHVTIDSQLEEDLFAKASQSVADLTSSASALYDKPGMFKAVSVAPSGAENALINSRFRINQEKPTLPIEAFFHELSGKN